MRSFFPNHKLINAVKRCGNPDCDKKEAEAEAEQSLLLNIMCPNCRTVYYCTIDCQNTHSKNHKHQCNKDAKKLKKLKKTNKWLQQNRNKENTDNDDDNDNDNESFQTIPPKDDCPICFFPLPIVISGSMYNPCCGKSLCNSCGNEDIRVTLERGRELIPCCPFCREPHPLTDNEIIVRMEKRMELNDSEAIHTISQYYKKGNYGLPQDLQKAFDLCLRAAELGNSKACNSAAIFYEDGVVVTKDMTKARNYCEMAAKKGSIMARYNLGVDEWEKGNHHIASRHWLISAAAGDADSLVEIAILYQLELVTKEEYATALTSYGTVHKNEYSIERENAAAAPR